MKIIIDIFVIVSCIAIIYIAIHYLIIDINNAKRIEQIDEEKNNTQIQIYEINRRVVALEKENQDEERDSTRKNKTSDKHTGRNR